MPPRQRRSLRTIQSNGPESRRLSAMCCGKAANRQPVRTNPRNLDHTKDLNLRLCRLMWGSRTARLFALPMKAPAREIHFVALVPLFISAQKTIAIGLAVRSRAAEDGEKPAGAMRVKV
jgi:hypothetical protein